MADQDARILVAPEIAQQRAHFVQLQVERVGRVWLPLGPAVDDFARIFFGAKRTEQAIPDDQHTAEVAAALHRLGAVIGRASWRDSVCRSGWISAVAL